MKNPVTLAAIEPAIFRCVAQHLPRSPCRLNVHIFIFHAVCVDFCGSPFKFSNHATDFHKTSYELYITKENTGPDSVALKIYTSNNVMADGRIFETGPSL